MSFIQSNSVAFSEVEERKNGRDGILTFGVKYLDDAMLGILKSDLVLIGARSGSGKCLGIDTPVLMFDGSIKKVQDVVPGDLLMGPDSKHRTVITTAKGRGELYKIKPVKGDEWVCNDVHILSLRHIVKKEIVNIELNEFLKIENKKKYKQWRVGVDFPALTEPLPLDPYFVGIWLGDGSLASPSINCPDKEIHDFIYSYAPKIGMKVSKYHQPGKCPSVNLINGYQKPNKVMHELKKHCIKNNQKNISDSYLRASREDRLKLLAGLLDTDGYMKNNGFEITLKEKELSDQVLFLARSLGLAAYQRMKIGKIASIGFEGVYYRISISGHCDEIPNLVLRKKASPRRQVKDVLHTGFSVESIGVGDYYGFEIDGDRLFLLGDFTVTHNTAFCCNTAIANVRKGKRVHFIALEAEKYEIERRIKYQIFAKLFFKKKKEGVQLKESTITFQNWMVGDYIESLAEIEGETASIFANYFTNFFTFYKVDKFDVTDLVKTVVSCASETDLIIVDHVHYFDFDDDKENKAIKEIAKTARSLALENGIPIILVSHLRKKDRYQTDLAPSLEEFHGSSDLYKICTKAITLGPGSWTDGKLETYIRIVKNRFDGGVTRLLGSVNFLIFEGKYEDEYAIGDANQNKDSGFVQLNRADYPAWGDYTLRINCLSGHDDKGKRVALNDNGRPKTT